MTALEQYQRLETGGIWRSASEDQRRDVTVSLGTATLVISDSAGRALAHWSLPALERCNPGKAPAVYMPGMDTREELEISEPEMVRAIEKVRSVIERRRPHRGRLRGLLTVALLAALAVFAVVWVPDALIRHASTVVPQITRTDLGTKILGHIEKLAGRPCETESGSAALALMQSRLIGEGPGQLVVLSSGALATGHLPGGAILLNRRLIEDYDTPDVVAGYVLAEHLRAQMRDPMMDLLNHAGPLAAARLLTTGRMSEAVLSDYALALMTARPRPIDDQSLLEAFQRAQLASQPYAYAIDISGETTLSLIEADPGGVAPVLPDSDWVSLQAICGA
jgi:hypothetical protein